MTNNSIAPFGRWFNICLESPTIDSMKTKITKRIVSIPPTYFYLCLGFNLLLIFLSTKKVITYPNNLFGIPFIILGVYLISASYFQFIKNETPEKYKKSTCVIKNGLFRFSRNPMYIGAIIFLIGLATLIGDLWGFMSPVLLFLILNFMFIPYEEEKMKKEQGSEYLEYKKRVRRWI